MDCCQRLCSIASHSAKSAAQIAPVEHQQRCCVICLEPGGIKRKCCAKICCDHCYTKDKACPTCQAPTRQEKMTGATYMLQTHSEHEECRKCLDPGLKRMCCGNYFCDDCYYSFPSCPSCDAPVGRRGLMTLLGGRASILSVIIGWMALAFFILAVLGLMAFITASEAQTPITISKYQCNGIFRTCDTHYCLATTENVANGSEPFPSLYGLKYCTLDTDVKIQAWGCAFDPQLYTQSEKTLGYDYCANEFNNGAYIFEDTFEAWVQPLDWRTNLMRSAKWGNIVNGQATDDCGVGLPDGAAGGGIRALSFSGLVERFAETLPLDVSSGGWVEFDAFLSPQGFEQSHPYCRPCFAGVVNIEYSVNGTDWIVLEELYPWYHTEWYFFKVKIVLPPEAITTHTLFRVIQHDFVAVDDSWAIDNFRVFRYFPDNWDNNPKFEDNVALTKTKMDYASCCFDTEFCDSRLSADDFDECERIQGFTANEYVLRGTELYILIVVTLNVMKFIYVSTMNWYMKKLLPFTDEFRALVKLDFLMKYIPARYRPKKDIADMVSDIHISARLVGELRDMIQDDDDVDEDAIRLKEVEKKERKKRKREKFKRKKKLGYSDIDAAIDSSDEDEEIAAQEQKAGSEVVLTSDLEMLKRQNVAMLRIPFDIKIDVKWRRLFVYTSIGMFVVMFLVTASLVRPYIVSQTVTSFGSLKSTVVFTSTSISFFAFLCDFKELYYNLKNVVPLTDEMVPFLTLDVSQEGNALYLGRHCVRLSDVSEANAFGRNFAIASAIAYLIGSFPWCMLSLTIRELYLQYQVTRILAPTLMFIMGMRAILGSSFLIKVAFSMFYLWDFNLVSRDKLGKAFEAKKVKPLAYISSGTFALLGLFFSAIAAASLAGYAFGLGLLLGYVYGTIAGCSHSLPIKPWMLLTTLDNGVWFRVRKKELCPCIYWCGFCTEMHECDELFVVYPKDDIKFFEAVKNGKV